MKNHTRATSLSQFFIRNSKFEILLLLALVAARAHADSLPFIPEKQLSAIAGEISGESAKRTLGHGREP